MYELIIKDLHNNILFKEYYLTRLSVTQIENKRLQVQDLHQREMMAELRVNPSLYDTDKKYIKLV